MNALLNFEFKIEDASIELFDLEYSILSAKENIADYINTVTVSYFKSFSYEDNIWFVYNDNRDTFLAIDFNKFYAHENEKLLNVIKCWISNFLLDYSGGSIASNYRYLVDIINLTHFFNESKLETLEEYLLERAENTYKNDIIRANLNFLDFYDDVEAADDYIQLLSEHKGKFDDQRREIPSSRDCLNFVYVMNDFFSNIESSDWKYLYFEPLRIWWIITTKIPMRIGEFLRITRDSLRDEEINNKIRYFLSLPRSKEKNNKKRIQVIDEIEIDIKLFELIKHYIIETNKFGESDTLLSFIAYRKLRDENIGRSTVKKRNPKRMNLESFMIILYDFYEMVVKKPPYNLTVRDKGEDDLQTISKDREKGIKFDIERRLRPNDTRHLAFMFLKLQGLHPVEIARLGGHLSLSSQNHYFNHKEFETDSATVQLLRLFDMEGQYFKSKFFNINTQPLINTSITDEFRRRFILKNQEPDREKWDKMEVGWCTASVKRCKEHCFLCEEYWKIELNEFKEKYDYIVRWMSQANNDVLNIYNSLGQLHKQILSKKDRSLELNPNVDKILKTKSKELKSLLESIGVCVNHIYEQTGVNMEWQENIQKIKLTNYLTDM